MRRMRVAGNELARIPVIFAVTPNWQLPAVKPPSPCPVGKFDRRRGPLNAVISGQRYLKPGFDLYMNDEAGGKQRRARFQALCQSLRPDLLRFAFWLSRDRALAEDVVQESLLRAWKAQDSLLDAQAAKPWLLTIVRREFARTFERKRLPTVDIDDLVAREESVLGVSEDHDLAELRAAIFKLPDDYREPLTLQVL